MDKDTALYRFFDAEHDLLYVGITHRLEGRLAQHKRVKPWGDVASITLQWFPTRRDAIAAEIEAIQAERPLWNVKHQGDGMHPTYTGDNAGLVGMFFHVVQEYDDGCRYVNYQGEILERVADDLYLIGYFEWVAGMPTDGNELVSIDNMVGWLFYPDNETAIYAYETKWSHRHERHARHHVSD